MAKRRGKKTERTKLDEDCLKLWAKCIKVKRKTCQVTNSDYILSAHHIIEKNYRWGRYALDNGMTLSNTVHCLQKGWPEHFRDVILEALGEKEYTRLKEKYMYRPPCKRTITQLREIKEELKKELKRLESDWGRPFDPTEEPPF